MAGKTTNSVEKVHAYVQELAERPPLSAQQAKELIDLLKKGETVKYVSPTFFPFHHSPRIYKFIDTFCESLKVFLHFNKGSKMDELVPELLFQTMALYSKLQIWWGRPQTHNIDVFGEQLNWLFYMYLLSHSYHYKFISLTCILRTPNPCLSLDHLKAFSVHINELIKKYEEEKVDDSTEV